MFLLMVARRDIIRMWEYLSCQMILFSMNALCHVVTTLPDPNGWNASCQDPKYHNWGSWIYYDVTFSYCGDLIWSGHTVNTLLPLIMMRRMLWDYAGWNFNSKYEKVRPDTQADYGNKYVPNEQTRAQNYQKQGDSASPYHLNDVDADNNYDRYTYMYHQACFDRRRRNDNNRCLNVNPNGTVPSTAASSAVSTPVFGRGPGLSSDVLETMSGPMYQHAQMEVPKSMEAVHDDNVLHPHDTSDIHIPIQATQPEAGGVYKTAESNYDNDVFLHTLHSPYTTPSFVMRHHNLFVILSWIARFLLAVWFGVLVFTLLVIRYHYTVDIVVAIIVTCLVTGNSRLIQWWLRMTYRPYYHNYVYNKWWKPVYLRWPLNAEQLSYEERVRRVGLGGYF